MALTNNKELSKQYIKDFDNLTFDELKKKYKTEIIRTEDDALQLYNKCKYRWD